MKYDQTRFSSWFSWQCCTFMFVAGGDWSTDAPTMWRPCFILESLTFQYFEDVTCNFGCSWTMHAGTLQKPLHNLIRFSKFTSNVLEDTQLKKNYHWLHPWICGRKGQFVADLWEVWLMSRKIIYRNQSWWLSSVLKLRLKKYFNSFSG